MLVRVVCHDGGALKMLLLVRLVLLLLPLLLGGCLHK